MLIVRLVLDQWVENLVALAGILVAILTLVLVALALPLAIDSRSGQAVLRRLGGGKPRLRRLSPPWLPVVVIGLEIAVGMAGYTLVASVLGSGPPLALILGVLLSVFGFGFAIFSQRPHSARYAAVRHLLRVQEAILPDKPDVSGGVVKDFYSGLVEFAKLGDDVASFYFTPDEFKPKPETKLADGTWRMSTGSFVERTVFELRLSNALDRLRRS